MQIYDMFTTLTRSSDSSKEEKTQTDSNRLKYIVTTSDLTIDSIVMRADKKNDINRSSSTNNENQFFNRLQAKAEIKSCICQV